MSKLHLYYEYINSAKTIDSKSHFVFYWGDWSFTGVEIRLFCLAGHFWVWCKSHCSSPIATIGFGGAVTPPFFPAFAGSFPYFSYREVPDLQKINLSTHLFYPLFFSRNTSSIAILFPTPLKSKAKQGWHFRKANIPRGYSILSHKHTIKYNPFDLKTFDITSKTALVVTVRYNLLNLSLRLLQICSYSFTDFPDRILIKLPFQ